MDELSRHPQDIEPYDPRFELGHPRDWKHRLHFELKDDTPEKYHNSQLLPCLIVYLWRTEIGAIVYESFFTNFDTTSTARVFKINPDAKDNMSHHGGLLPQDIEEIARAIREDHVGIPHRIRLHPVE